MNCDEPINVKWDVFMWNLDQMCVSQCAFLFTYEPPHDKTNNVAMRPAKTQISLGICPVWSESSLSAWRKVGSLATH